MPPDRPRGSPSSPGTARAGSSPRTPTSTRSPASAGAERRLRAFGHAAVGAHCDGLFQAVQARVAYEQRGRMSGKIGPFVIQRAGTADEDFGCTARDVTEREELRMRVAEVNALYRVADAIARATGLDDLLAEAVDALVEATDADRASVLLFDDTGVMRFRAWHGLSDEYRSRTDGHSPWTPEDVDPEPVLVADVASAGLDAEIEKAAS